MSRRSRILGAPERRALFNSLWSVFAEIQYLVTVELIQTPRPINSLSWLDHLTYIDALVSAEAASVFFAAGPTTRPVVGRSPTLCQSARKNHSGSTDAGAGETFFTTKKIIIFKPNDRASFDFQVPSHFVVADEEKYNKRQVGIISFNS